MNILIVAHHFPPENAMASLRPYSWAKYWSKLGHRVCVLTTQKEVFDAPLTLDLDVTPFDVVELPYLLKRRKTTTDLAKNSCSSPLKKKQQSINPLVIKARRLRRDRKSVV